MTPASGDARTDAPSGASPDSPSPGSSSDAGGGIDVLVLGGGSGGYATALRAAQFGYAVTLVEADLLGGTCLHRGCIPTKAYLHAAEIADSVRDSEAFGVHASLDRVDAAGVRTYADRAVDRLYKGLTGLVRAGGIDVVKGRGRLVPAEAGVGVEVDGAVLTARHVVLATGSEPRTIPGIEIDGERVITSDHALRMTSVPSSVVVLGGGVIGVEFASLWRSYGVEVTVVEALDRLVPAEDAAISTALQRAFRKRGITVRTGVPVDSVAADASGVTVTVADDTIVADQLLVAVGRGPVSQGLGYAECGVALERGFVTVDERLHTSSPGVRAVGDLVSGLQLAHRGFAQGIFVAEDIAHSEGRLALAPTPVSDEQVPRVTYCDPQLASVGWTEEQARERYGDAVETTTYDLAGNGRAQILRTQGLVKLVRVSGGPVIGVHMVGAGVGELIGEAQLITNWEAHPEEVAGLVHAHPTLDEALGEAHLALAGKPLHGHG